MLDGEMSPSLGVRFDRAEASFVFTNDFASLVPDTPVVVEPDIR